MYFEQIDGLDFTFTLDQVKGFNHKNDGFFVELKDKSEVKLLDLSESLTRKEFEAICNATITKLHRVAAYKQGQEAAQFSDQGYMNNPFDDETHPQSYESWNNGFTDGREVLKSQPKDRLVQIERWSVQRLDYTETVTTGLPLDVTTVKPFTNVSKFDNVLEFTTYHPSYVIRAEYHGHHENLWVVFRLRDNAVFRKLCVLPMSGNTTSMQLWQEVARNVPL